MALVHPTAHVEDGAILAADVVVGAFSFVGRDVELGSGVRVVKPADDPSAAGRIVRLDEAVARNDQYLKNIDEASARNDPNWLASASSMAPEPTIPRRPMKRSPARPDRRAPRSARTVGATTRRAATI